MSEGTVHPLVQPVGRTHASGAFDWRAVPSADPRTSAFALDTAPAPRRRLKNSPAKPAVKSSKIF